MMRLSCLSLSYQNQFRAGKMDLPAFIRTARALDLDGVDLHMQHLKSFDRIYLRQLRRLCLDNGMSIPSFPVSTEFGLYPDRINAEIEKCRVAMETGLFLGAPLVRVFVGSTPPGGNPQDAFARGVDALRRCAEIGADIGMVVALQNHSGLTSTGDDMLRFHQAVNHPNFSLVLDTGHFTGRHGPNGPKQGRAHRRALLPQPRPGRPPRPLRPRQALSGRRTGPRTVHRLPPRLRYPPRRPLQRLLSLVYEGAEDELAAIPRGARFLRRVMTAA